MVNVDVTEHLLLHGIGDEPIFVTQMSQIVKHNENTTFSDISGTSQKPICVVVNRQSTRSPTLSLLLVPSKG